MRQLWLEWTGMAVCFLHADLIKSWKSSKSTINKIIPNSKLKFKKTSWLISCRWPAAFTIEDRSIVEHWERIWPLSIQSRKRLLLWRVHFWAIIKNIKTSEFRRKTTISWFSQRTKSVSWTIKIRILGVSLPMISLWMWDLAKILMNFLELQVIQFLNGTWGLINQWKLTEPDWGIRLWKWTKITFAPEADWVWFTFMKITNPIQIDSLYTSKSQTLQQQSVIFRQTGTKA